MSPEFNHLTPANLVMLGPKDGESFNIIGGGVRILIDGASSGGRCFVLEAPIPPGEGPPLHRHENEDELFYIVRGRFKFSVDGNEFFAEPGSFACAPRGSIHAFKNVGDTEALMVVTTTPSGLEDAFRAVRLPEPGSDEAPPTMEEMIEVFGAHGITFHGPPL